MVNGNNLDNSEGLKSTIKLVTCFCGYYYYLKGVPPPLLVSKMGTIPLNLLDQSQNFNYSLRCTYMYQLWLADVTWAWTEGAMECYACACD